MDADIKQRMMGVAVGAAVGDALGMALELHPRVETDRLVTSMKAGRLAAGNFTDDTEMALALAESLLAKKPLDPDDLARRFLAWYRKNPSDVDNHTREVMERIAHGASGVQAGEAMLHMRPDSAGNGSVMRCWPVALAWWDNRPALLLDSALQSRVTHANAECVAASVFINVWIAELIGGTALRAAYDAALASVDMPPSFRQALVKAPARKREELPNSGWARHSVESAVWGLLTTGSFREALIQVVNLGNDADTAASVTGAVAGAAYGLDAIPAEWQQALHGEWPLRSRTVWKRDDFMRLAGSLGRLPE